MDWPEELLEIFDDPLLADVRPKPKRLRLMTGWRRNCSKSTSGWQSMVVNPKLTVA